MHLLNPQFGFIHSKCKSFACFKRCLHTGFWQRQKICYENNALTVESALNSLLYTSLRRKAHCCDDFSPAGSAERSASSVQHSAVFSAPQAGGSDVRSSCSSFKRDGATQTARMRGLHAPGRPLWHAVAM